MSLLIALVTFLLLAGLLEVSLLAAAARLVWIVFRGRRPGRYARLAYSGALGVSAALGLFVAAIFARCDVENVLFHDLLRNGLFAVALGGLLGVVARGITLQSEAS